MTNTIIKVEGLSKKFVIGHQKQQGYTALRDVIAQNVKGALSRTSRFLKSSIQSSTEIQEDFWALKDINFDVLKGERVGIIGRNGAGKSTLLKILSRITEPSSGKITLSGRVASLLEVGTGFHPELSGRENIYLNGAILGMGRAEIKRKFDEIVAFAEVEKFLDTPVKRYSSGMYVRLAFAVAAHLEPEILIVDEVLAVGDAQFQKKCLGKMEDVSKNEGRTVLFVSHNMGVLKQICEKCIFLKGGELYDSGPTKDVVDKYLELAIDTDGKYYHKEKSSYCSITSILVNGSKNSLISIYENIKLEISYSSLDKAELEFFVLIYNSNQEVLISYFSKDSDFKQAAFADLSSFSVSFENQLLPGKYFISAGAITARGEFADWVDMAESFEVAPSFSNGTGYDGRYGMLTSKASWLNERI